MSAPKPNGRPWRIPEQVIRDRVTGLTIQFEVRRDGTPVLRLYGECLPFGNREIGFDARGHEADSGTATASCPVPNWIRGVSRPTGS
jgi:hypothetical protein